MIRVQYSETITMKQRQLVIGSLLTFLMLLLAACSSPAADSSGPAGKVKVVATTTLIGDIVKNIGGEQAVRLGSGEFVGALIVLGGGETGPAHMVRLRVETKGDGTNGDAQIRSAGG